MRSAVRICLAAPRESLESQRIQGFFLCLKKSFPLVFPYPIKLALQSHLCRAFHVHIIVHTMEKYKRCFSLHDTVDVLLHPLGAGLFHLIGHVAVDVQRKSCRGMTQVALYCLDVVTGANGSNGVGVS